MKEDTAFAAFLYKLQVFFKIVRNGRELHTLIGLLDANGIDLVQSKKLGKCSENRLYRTLPLSLQFH